MRKIYEIPIIYQRIETIPVEAEDLQDAVNKAVKQFLAIPDENYLEDSFEVDEYVRERYDEDYDIDKTFESL